MTAHARRRDPRAAPLNAQRNVSTVESCAFYGVADALTKCRLPRTCRDCLAKLGCVLNLWGQCVEEDARLHTNDTLSLGLAAQQADQTPRQPLLVPQSNPTRDQRVFFAKNASYCAASDPICSACRTQFQAAAQSPDSRVDLINQFCVGLGGCVCSGVCEVPGYRSVWAEDQDCGQPRSTYVSEQRPSLPVISSTRRDPRAPLKPRIQRRQVAQTCALYGEVDVQGCRQPRNASACSQKEHCVYTGVYCKDAATRSSLSSPGLVQFETWMAQVDTLIQNNATVCQSSDPQCAECGYDTGFDTALHNASVSCFGANLCWCGGLVQAFAQFLHPPDFLSQISNPKNQCRLGAVHELDVTMWIVTVVMFFMLLCGGIVGLYHDDPNRRVRAMTRNLQQQAMYVWRHMLDTVPGDLHLDLFGWRQHRRELYYKEQQLLRGYENLSPVVAPVKFATFPSAPDFDFEEESSAPSKQDPMALASAPVFRKQGDGGGISKDELQTLASAPMFDEVETVDPVVI